MWMHLKFLKDDDDDVKDVGFDEQTTGDADVADAVNSSLARK